MLNLAERRHGEPPLSTAKHRTAAAEKVSRKYRRAMIRRAEYLKLKAIVPSVAQKKAVSKLTVIEEAIRYIDELHEALAKKMNADDCCRNSVSNECNPDVFIRDLCSRKLFGFEDPSLPSLHSKNSASSSSLSSSSSSSSSTSFSNRTPLANVQQQQRRRRFPGNCETTESEDDDENETLLAAEEAV